MAAIDGDSLTMQTAGTFWLLSIICAALAWRFSISRGRCANLWFADVSGTGSGHSLDIEDEDISDQREPVVPLPSAKRANSVFEHQQAVRGSTGAASVAGLPASLPTPLTAPDLNTPLALAATNAQQFVDVQEALTLVDKSIVAVEADIKTVKQELLPFAQDFKSPRAAYLRVEEQQLRVREQQLRVRDQQLRDKQKGLRDEKLLIIQSNISDSIKKGLSHILLNYYNYYYYYYYY
jgi:hypothetical protein